MKNSIHIINGVNINMVGKRERTIYGTEDIFDIQKELEEEFSDLDLRFFYSNIEGQIVEYIQNIENMEDAIVINPGAYTHTSVAIADALRVQKHACIEVHISNVFSREPYRAKSFISEVSMGSISGLGKYGYSLAIQFLSKK